MKVLISGSRSIKIFNLSEYIPSNTELIICGGAEGIDTIAERYADQHRLSKLVLRPQYKLYGRAAPIKRNEEMVDMADLIIVIWDGISKGSQHTIRYAKKQNKALKVIERNSL